MVFRINIIPLYHLLLTFCLHFQDGINIMLFYDFILCVCVCVQFHAYDISIICASEFYCPFVVYYIVLNFG